MVNYANTKIYKIESITGEGQCYVGSTTKQYLSQRMDTYRVGYKKWKNDDQSFVSVFKLFDEYGVKNCRIILLEAFPCDNTDEKNSKEAEYIKDLDCVNKIDIVSNKTDSKDYYNEYYHKTNIVITCPNCGKETPKRNIASHKKGIKCQLITLKKVAIDN